MCGLTTALINFCSKNRPSMAVDVDHIPTWMKSLSRSSIFTRCLEIGVKYWENPGSTVADITFSTSISVVTLLFKSLHIQCQNLGNLFQSGSVANGANGDRQNKWPEINKIGSQSYKCHWWNSIPCRWRDSICHVFTVPQLFLKVPS